MNDDARHIEQERKNDSQSRFPLDQVAAAIQEKKPYPLHEFSYQVRGETEARKLAVVIKNFKLITETKVNDQSEVVQVPSEPMRYGVFIEIIQNGETLGVISGQVMNNGNSFVSIDIENYGIDDKKKSHVPGVVAETIRQLISEGFFNVWYSSHNLMPRGQTMYETMSHTAEQNNLSVVFNEHSYQGDPRWEIRRKAENKTT